MKSLIATALLAGAALAAQDAQQKPTMDASSCPMHEEHMKAAKAKEVAAKDQRFAEMNARGEAHAGMNFSQTATTHQFIGDDQGGYIQVTVKDVKDAKLMQTVREHLQHIAASFTAKDFSIPNFVHGEYPAGTDDMIRLADRITYKYEETPNGGRVAIRTRDKDALQAVHSFLGYQVTEHRTADGNEHNQRFH
jgi:hypothetical protein